MARKKIVKKVKKMKNPDEKILILSDLHIPYQHPDTIAFLTKIKNKYKPTKVISVGDETDKHALSFHNSDPDLPSAGQELRNAIETLKPLYKLFPVMDLVDSNHGSMVYRKALANGIPKKYIRDYGEVLEAPKTWKWHNTLIFKLSNGQKVFVCHGIKKNGRKLTEQMGMNTIQGHYHTEFNIQYHSSPDQLCWSLQVGCSIDDKSMAFAYNKITPGRPIIGHAIIINGVPHLLPMLLDKKGKWTGYLP